MSRSRLQKLVIWIIVGGLSLVNASSLVLRFPRPAYAVTKMLLLWDDGTYGAVPSGWTTDATYNDLMLRGNTTAGGTGGSDTHTHTITNANVDTVNTGSNAQQKKGSATVSAQSHTHAITSSSMSNESSLPPYRGLMVIANDSGIPTTLPLNIIVLFDTASLSGDFSRYSAQDNYFGRGASTAGGTGGSSALHGHSSVAFGTGNPNSTEAAMVTGAAVTANTSTHSHSLTGSTTDTDGDIAPPHVNTVLARVTTDGIAIPAEMISIFDAAPGTGWNSLSGVGGDFNQKYIEGTSTYAAAQGNATHNHNKTGGYTTNTVSTGTGLGTGTPAKGVATSHAHPLASPTFSDGNNAPAYKDVIVGKKLAELGVTAPANITLTAGNPSQTLDTTFPGGSEVTVTDGGNGWSITVIMQTTLTSGGNTIPNANVKIRKDGLVDSGSYTIWGGTYTNVAETNATESLDVSRTVGTRSSGTSGDSTTTRPSIQVVIPGIQAAGDYVGAMRFTVA